MRSDRLSRVTQSAYGRDLARNFGVTDAPPTIVTRALQHTQFAATEIRVDHPTGELIDTIPPQDAYMICFVLRDLPDNSYWEDGHEYARYFLRAGDTAISDLRRQPISRIDKPLHSVCMYLPFTTLNTLAEQANRPRVKNLHFEPGAGFRDETVRHLCLSLLPALRTPERANRLFTDHIALALATHAAHAYGDLDCSQPIHGGLAPWQEKRAKDMILHDLVGRTSLQAIAEACGLSVGHFSRSFRKTTGLAPHAWLIQARIERAMTLLRRRDLPLASIARECGFADQSHFTRVFVQRIGITPRSWQRLTLS